MAKKIIFTSEENLSELECLVGNGLIRMQITDSRTLDAEYLTLDESTVIELIDYLNLLLSKISDENE